MCSLCGRTGTPFPHAGARARFCTFPASLRMSLQDARGPGSQKLPGPLLQEYEKYEEIGLFSVRPVRAYRCTLLAEGPRYLGVPFRHTGRRYKPYVGT